MQHGHSFSKVSTLAAVHYRNTDFPGPAEFGKHISLLRLEYFRQSVASQLQSEKLGHPFHGIWQISRGYLVALYKIWKELCDELDFTFIRWIDLRLDNIRRIFCSFTIFTPIPKPRVDIGFGPVELENSMRQAFLLVKEISRNNPGNNDKISGHCWSGLFQYNHERGYDTSSRRRWYRDHTVHRQENSSSVIPQPT